MPNTLAWFMPVRDWFMTLFCIFEFAFLSIKIRFFWALSSILRGGLLFTAAVIELSIFTVCWRLASPETTLSLCSRSVVATSRSCDVFLVYVGSSSCTVV